MTELTKEQLYRPGMEGIPACHSKIGFINGIEGVLEYRGYPIEALCKYSSFEEVSYLLLFAKLPSATELKAFKKDLKKARHLSAEVLALITSLPKTGHPMVMLQSVISALGLFDPHTDLRDEKKNYQSIVNVIAKTPSIIAAFDRYRQNAEPIEPDEELCHAANFLYMLNGHKPSELESKIFDVCLILHAEHSLNASTFSTRVTASTRNNPYISCSAGIGTLYGPLHGGANERVLEMLEAIGKVEFVKPFVEEKLAKKEKIMGIGHRVYRTKDPRSFILQDIARELFSQQNDNTLLDIALELEKVTGEKLSSKGIYPNVDFFSGLVYRILGFETDLFTPIFAAARTSGWCAHWLEQMEDNRLFRPSQIYDGDRNLSYTQVEDR
ncbi:MAG: citrate synthase [Deltaproteobacteria bacterium]|nr:citrate synthase [Deltaproteobacteria bacterium]